MKSWKYNRARLNYGALAHEDSHLQIRQWCIDTWKIIKNDSVFDDLDEDLRDRFEHLEQDINDRYFWGHDNALELVAGMIEDLVKYCDGEGIALI